MKIAYLITRMDEYGGAQIHVRDLSLWLLAQGHEVTVIAGSAGEISEGLEKAGVRFEEVPALGRAIHPIKDSKAVLALRRVLRDVAPDILSCHSSKAGLIGRLAAWSLRIPVIFTAHGWAFTSGVSRGPRLVYQAMERFAGPLGDHIITVSDFDRALALDARIAPRARVTTVHNGMPDKPPPVRYFRAGELPQRDVRLLMVARFGPQKDHGTLLEALATMKDLPWTLSLVGGGDSGAAQKRAAELDLGDRVFFLGERSDVPDLMEREADVYCLISNWEGLPRSILEAMRAGLPVVASNVGGTRECVADGLTGCIVPPKDPETLARTLRRQITEAPLRAQMGRNGRLRFENEFTFLAMAEKTLGIYRKAAKQGAASAAA